LFLNDIINFNPTIRSFKNYIIILGKKNIVVGHLFKWKEYLEFLTHKMNCELLALLKVSLDLYNGELKGYAEVPDEKEIREGMLKVYLKEIIRDAVQKLIRRW
jgi:hypothetical protein